jgi:hypothetical protein
MMRPYEAYMLKHEIGSVYVCVDTNHLIHSRTYVAASSEFVNTP